MPAKLILFDIDGTLIDSRGAGRVAMERAFHRVFRIDGISTRASGVRYAGMTDPIILQSIAQAIGIERTRFDAHRDELVRIFVEELESELGRPDPKRRVLPGVRELLEYLAGRGEAHLGLVTGNIEAGAWAKLGALGLADYFTDGGFSSDHADRREIARLARTKIALRSGISFSTNDVVVVGDTEHDVDCARANGFRAVAVDSGWIARERLEQAQPDHLLDDLTDLDLVLQALGFARRIE